MEIFSGKRDFLKGTPNFPNSAKGIFKWKSAFQLLVFTSSGPFGLDRLLNPIFRDKVVEMERAHPTENSHLGFDVYHSLSTDAFF